MNQFTTLKNLMKNVKFFYMTYVLTDINNCYNLLRQYKNKINLN